jgi:replicative DNA helicase
MYERQGISVDNITHAAEQLEARYGHVRLVIVDYLQELVAPHRKDTQRYQEIGEMVHRLANLAKALDCPVLVASQFHRDKEREKERPRKSDLYESGRIEQAADVILLLWRLSSHFTEAEYFGQYDKRPEWSMYGKYTYPGDQTEIIIAKRRTGGDGTPRTVRVHYDQKNGYRGIVPVMEASE